MARIFHPLLMMLAGCEEKGLARQIQYLKEEHRILRSKLPKRITIMPEERRRLLKFGKPSRIFSRSMVSIPDRNEGRARGMSS